MNHNTKLVNRTLRKLLTYGRKIGNYSHFLYTSQKHLGTCQIQTNNISFDKVITPDTYLDHSVSKMDMTKLCMH